MKSAALDDACYAGETWPGADAVLEARTRRADVPRVLVATTAELTPAPSVAYIDARPACTYAINHAACDAVASLPSYLVNLCMLQTGGWPAAFDQPQQEAVAGCCGCNASHRSTSATTSGRTPERVQQLNLQEDPPCRWRSAEKRGRWASASELQPSEVDTVLALLACLMRETAAYSLAPDPGLR